jgi:transcriptional regulator with XRE-family HTH domain
MTSQHGRAFNEWLRAQLKAKKMSQRQLAQQSGVDHSTISRLIRGDRMPSLGTATKLARGLRELRDDADATQYLGIVASGTQNPTARVEYALRADELLNEAQVRQIMEYYLAVRMRRFGRAFQPGESSGSRNEGSGGGNGHPPSHNSPAGAAGPASTEGTLRRVVDTPPSAIAVGTVTRVGGSRSGVVRSINGGQRRY